jgi:hypothetical protein
LHIMLENKNVARRSKRIHFSHVQTNNCAVSYVKQFYCQTVRLRNSRLFLTALNCVTYKYIILHYVGSCFLPLCWFTSILLMLHYDTCIISCNRWRPRDVSTSAGSGVQMVHEQWRTFMFVLEGRMDLVQNGCEPGGRPRKTAFSFAVI